MAVLLTHRRFSFWVFSKPSTPTNRSNCFGKLETQVSAKSFQRIQSRLWGNENVIWHGKPAHGARSKAAAEWNSETSHHQIGTAGARSTCMGNGVTDKGSGCVFFFSFQNNGTRDPAMAQPGVIGHVGCWLLQRYCNSHLVFFFFLKQASRDCVETVSDRQESWYCSCGYQWTMLLVLWV